MPELRKDPVTGRWVIIAPDRAKRPMDYQHELKLVEGRFDPFAEGNESATPPEIIAILNKEINAGLADRTIQARFADLGASVLPGTAYAFGQFIRDETAKWGKVIKAANIKI